MWVRPGARRQCRQREEPEERGGVEWEDRNCSRGRRKMSRERGAVVGACNLSSKVSMIISKLQMKKWRLRGNVSCPAAVRAGAGRGSVSYPQLPWTQDNNLPGSRLGMEHGGRQPW